VARKYFFIRYSPFLLQRPHLEQNVIATRIGSMKSAASILAWIAGAGLVFLTACGPDPAVLKNYVLTSPRNHVALMPLTVAERQVDVRNLAEDTLRDRLSALGFSIVDKPGLNDDGNTVFGPSTTAPRIEDVINYGARCRTAVVLVGRIERASEGRPFTFATHKTVHRKRRGPNGHDIPYDEDVIAQPERPARPPHLIINLKLFDTGTGRELWASKQDPIPAEWTLEEAVRYVIEQQATDLAAAYAARKL
jgi:hypothetical protein